MNIAEHNDDFWNSLETEKTQQKQEPVAWMHPEWRNYTRAPSPSVTPKEGWIPLYTSPPHRQPLTRKQIDEMADDGDFLGNVYEITRAIEAALGISGEKK